MTEAELVFQFPDAEGARRVFEAVHADDDAFCTTRLEGPRLVARLRGDGPRSLLRGVDDLLSAIAVAEDVIRTP